MKKQIIKAIFGLVISLFLTVGVAYAWYMTNKNVSGHSSNVQINGNNLYLTYNFYKYNKDSGVVEEVDSLVLNDYDTIIPENNNNTAFIIACNTKNVYDSFSLTISCSTDNTSSFCISNISSYSFVTSDVTYNSLDELYHTVVNNATDKSTFINNNNKSTSINKDFTNVTSSIIYIVVDYDEDLITQLNNGQSYISTHLSTTISFIPDLININFYVES